MKFKSIILSAFAVFSLVSCSNDNYSINSSTDNNGNNSGEGYLSISLASASTNNLRTAGSSTESAVVENDSKINSVTVLLVGSKGTDNAGKILQIFPSATYTAGTEPSTSNSFKVETGTYEVFAVVNPSGKVSQVLQLGNPIETVLSVAGNEELEGYAGSNGFLMINERNDADVSAGVAVNITSANTATKPAKAAIRVDRLVAAIKLASTTTSVKFNQNTSDASPSKIVQSVKVTGLLPIYARKNFNTVQKWETKGTSTILANPTPAITPDSIVIGNFYNRAQDLLVYDDNKVATSVKSSLDFRDLYYVLESRAEINESDSTLTSYNVGTTGVVFKIIALNSDDEAKTFYRVSQSNKYFYDRESAIKERNTLYSDQLATTTTKAEDLRKAGIRVYEDGVMYYTYYIKDNNYLYNNLPYYAVHRNAVYKLNVNNIYTVGSDLPTGEIKNPEKPELVINTYLSVSVSVNPWVLDVHNIDL